MILIRAQRPVFDFEISARTVRRTKMSVSIQLTPLYGVNTDCSALSYLLTIDGFNILLDCGWTDTFDPQFLNNLAQVAPSVNVVLLSHPDVAHLGALPYAVAKLGLHTATILSTLPVWRMGLMFMYDAYLSQESSKSFTIFNLDDVDAAFKSITNESSPRYQLLKYQQVFPLDTLETISSGAAKGLVVTPHPAGHMLGATVWHIRKRTESILYAVNFNHSREKCLNPTTLQSFDRPSHLIVSAARARTHTRTRRPSDITDTIRQTFDRGGSVLIPVDTAGRLIELTVQLHKAWESDSELSKFPLIIMHPLSSSTFDFARSMIEWMSDEVVKNFDISRDNLFLFKHVKHIQSIKALDAIHSPVLVLASSVTMQIGFSREIFVRWCQNQNNTVILTDRPEPNTLYATVYEYASKNSQTKENSQAKESLKLSLSLKRKERLQGEELEKWREEERIKKEKEMKELRQKEDEERRAKEEAEREASLANPDLIKSEELANDEQNRMDVQMISIEAVPVPVETPEQSAEKQRKFLISQLQELGVISTEKAPMFPYNAPTRHEWDDYGQIVDTKRFMIGEDPGEGAPEEPTDFDVAANMDEVKEAVEENIPSKYIEEDVELDVRCQLIIIDHSGLSDGDSIKRIIKQIEPRHVTLIAGSKEDTGHLAQYLQSTLFVTSLKPSPVKVEATSAKQEQQAFVMSPSEMEKIDITSHTTEYEFTLHDSVINNTHWNEVKLSKLAFADVIVTGDKDENGMQILKSIQESTENKEGMMDIDRKPDSSRTFEDDVLLDSQGHSTVFVGTIMLKELKDKIGQAGLKAEFAEGALCVENTDTGAVVLLKKDGAQHIVMEGSFSEEYFVVKDLLYNELVIPQ